ncbi:hypothetical protein NDU88_002399 [Pleurodeles waltl]|uniref:Uncharacterized protein n=1 Tax=Pleurodeles waltl TaxID=8319 RepID=A0AAV7SBU3_PLEWA|nr:hypothetical protein NDU88_002399 [Pleurodeles waltl]
MIRLQARSKMLGVPDVRRMITECPATMVSRVSMAKEIETLSWIVVRRSGRQEIEPKCVGEDEVMFVEEEGV